MNTWTTVITVIVVKLNSCNIPVTFMETTRLLATRAARQGLCSHACVLRRGEPRTGLCVPRRCQIGPWGSPTAPCARVERPN